MVFPNGWKLHNGGRVEFARCGHRRRPTTAAGYEVVIEATVNTAMTVRLLRSFVQRVARKGSVNAPSACGETVAEDDSELGLCGAPLTDGHSPIPADFAQGHGIAGYRRRRHATVNMNNARRPLNPLVVPLLFGPTQSDCANLLSCPGIKDARTSIHQGANKIGRPDIASLR
jgi:hypothetical protein